MDKKDQKKIIGIGILIVIVLVFLIGWIINVDSPSQALTGAKHTVTSNQHTSHNDSSSIMNSKKDNNQIAKHHRHVMKRTNSFLKTEN